MIEMIKMTVVLTLISCGAALLIAFTNSKTIERIAYQKAADQKAALQQIVPEGSAITECRITIPSQKDSLLYWKAVNGSDTSYIFTVDSRGYSSVITFLVCVDTSGIIDGLTILSQNETPGLGSRLQEVLSKSYFWNGFTSSNKEGVSWFSEQFSGLSVNASIEIDKSVGEWHNVNDTGRKALKEKNTITAITGSTISTNAIVKGLSGKARSYLNVIRGSNDTPRD